MGKLKLSSSRQAWKLAGYLKPHLGLFLTGLFFLLGSSLASLVFPFALGKLIDSALPGGKSPFSLDQITMLLFGVLITQALFSYFRILLFVLVSERSIGQLRKDLFRRMLHLPMGYFASHRVGELNSRISSDISQIQDTLTSTTAELVRQIVVLIGGVAFLFLVSTQLSLIMLSVVPILVITAVLFGRFIRKLSKNTQDSLAESQTVVEECLQAIQMVKSYANETWESMRYGNAIDRTVALAIKGGKYRGMFASFVILCLFGAIVFVIWNGARLVSQGAMSFGDLTSFILYSTFVGAAMGSFAELFARVQKALGATERVVEILDTPIEDEGQGKSKKETKPKSSGRSHAAFLTMEGVDFAYPSRPEVQVLKDIHLSIQEGETVALVGPSGAGKSSLVQLVLRFYSPSKGRVHFKGRALDHWPLHDYRNLLAMVPQEVILFGGTIYENIAYGNLKAGKEAIWEASRQAHAHEFITEFPQGYETLVGERGIKLSGGQRQRIAIARAILRDPELLILDEATSALDSQSEKTVQAALESLMKDRTTLIIAHRLSTVKKADRILVMEKGRIVEQGSHKELIKIKKGLYHHLTQLQSLEDLVQ